MSDLLVTVYTPALGSGLTVRTYGVARALAAHGPLTLLYTPFGAAAPDAAFQAIEGIELVEVVPSRAARRVASYLHARAGLVPDRFARGISPELAAAAARLAAAPGRRRGGADGPIAAAALRGLAARRPVIYNAHNIESGFRHERGAGAAGPRRNLEMRRYERRILQSSSESWMVSHAQVRAARAIAPGAALRYVPNVVDVAAIAPVPAPGPEPIAMFVANFAYWPNRNAVAFLRDEVMPRVWAQLPDARLLLVGGGLEAGAGGEDPRIEAAGFVEDLGAAYGRAACAVVPLLQSGGTPLKFVEALAYGMPVVATPLAAEGLEVRDGENCLLAAGAEQFAAALTGVLRDGAPGLGAAARRLAEERYSIEALTRLLAPGA